MTQFYNKFLIYIKITSNQTYLESNWHDIRKVIFNFEL